MFLGDALPDAHAFPMICTSYPLFISKIIFSLLIEPDHGRQAQRRNPYPTRKLFSARNQALARNPSPTLESCPTRKLCPTRNPRPALKLSPTLNQSLISIFLAMQLSPIFACMPSRSCHPCSSTGHDLISLMSRSSIDFIVLSLCVVLSIIYTQHNIYRQKSQAFFR